MPPKIHMVLFGCGLCRARWRGRAGAEAESVVRRRTKAVALRYDESDTGFWVRDALTGRTLAHVHTAGEYCALSGCPFQAQI